MPENWGGYPAPHYDEYDDCQCLDHAAQRAQLPRLGAAIGGAYTADGTCIEQWSQAAPDQPRQYEVGPATPVFDEAACCCDHPPAAHDDGFGCTAPLDAELDPDVPCPCIAGWVFDAGT